MPLLEAIAAQLDRLASLEPSPFPVLSLYLTLLPDEHGREHFEPFLRKELPERICTFPLRSPERQSLERDAEKVHAFLSDVNPAARGMALFASSGSDLFEALELEAPIAEHRLHISAQPHLYPLARLLDQYPRYAVLLADTQVSRIFVVAANAVEQTQQIEGVHTRRHKMGGWSQARFQRHVDNYHMQHAKEVVDTLARIIRAEAIQSVVVAGDDVALPLMKEHFTREISDLVVDMKRDDHSSDREVLEAAIAAMREKDAKTDREHVDAMLDAYRSGGLGVVGVEATRLALERGQVDELIVAADPNVIVKTGDPATAKSADRSPAERIGDQLIAMARQTAARVRFIEDVSLLASMGGVGAMLRFRL